MKMQFQIRKYKSPLAPLYERGVKHNAEGLPPFVKGDGRGIFGNEKV
jgi:hypothetical protein